MEEVATDVQQRQQQHTDGGSMSSGVGSPTATSSNRSRVCRICHGSVEEGGEEQQRKKRKHGWKKKKKLHVAGSSSGSGRRAEEDEEERRGPIISPCRCKGSIQYAHTSCLLTWILKRKSIKCDVCGTVLTVRKVFDSVLPPIKDLTLFSSSSSSRRPHTPSTPTTTAQLPTTSTAGGGGDDAGRPPTGLWIKHDGTHHQTRSAVRITPTTAVKNMRRWMANGKRRLYILWLLGRYVFLSYVVTGLRFLILSFGMWSVGLPIYTELVFRQFLGYDVPVEIHSILRRRDELNRQVRHDQRAHHQQQTVVETSTAADATPVETEMSTTTANTGSGFQAVVVVPANWLLSTLEAVWASFVASFVEDHDGDSAGVNKMNGTSTMHTNTGSDDSSASASVASSGGGLQTALILQWAWSWVVGLVLLVFITLTGFILLLIYENCNENDAIFENILAERLGKKGEEEEAEGEKIDDGEVVVEEPPAEAAAVAAEEEEEDEWEDITTESSSIHSNNGGNEEDEEVGQMEEDEEEFDRQQQGEEDYDADEVEVQYKAELSEEEENSGKDDCWGKKKKKRQTTEAGDASSSSSSSLAPVAVMVLQQLQQQRNRRHRPTSAGDEEEEVEDELVNRHPDDDDDDYKDVLTPPPPTVAESEGFGAVPSSSSSATTTMAAASFATSNIGSTLPPPPQQQQGGKEEHTNEEEEEEEPMRGVHKTMEAQRNNPQHHQQIKGSGGQEEVQPEERVQPPPPRPEASPPLQEQVLPPVAVGGTTTADATELLDREQEEEEEQRTTPIVVAEKSEHSPLSGPSSSQSAVSASSSSTAGEQGKELPSASLASFHEKERREQEEEMRLLGSFLYLKEEDTPRILDVLDRHPERRRQHFMQQQALRRQQKLIWEQLRQQRQRLAAEEEEVRGGRERRRRRRRKGDIEEEKGGSTASDISYDDDDDQNDLDEVPIEEEEEEENFVGGAVRGGFMEAVMAGGGGGGQDIMNWAECFGLQGSILVTLAVFLFAVISMSGVFVGGFTVPYLVGVNILRLLLFAMMSMLQMLSPSAEGSDSDGGGVDQQGAARHGDPTTPQATTTVNANNSIVVYYWRWFVVLAAASSLLLLVIYAIHRRIVFPMIHSADDAAVRTDVAAEGGNNMKKKKKNTKSVLRSVAPIMAFLLLLLPLCIIFCVLTTGTLREDTGLLGIVCSSVLLLLQTALASGWVLLHTCLGIGAAAYRISGSDSNSSALSSSSSSGTLMTDLLTWALGLYVVWDVIRYFYFCPSSTLRHPPRVAAEAAEQEEQEWRQKHKRGMYISACLKCVSLQLLHTFMLPVLFSIVVVCVCPEFLMNSMDVVTVSYRKKMFLHLVGNSSLSSSFITAVEQQQDGKEERKTTTAYDDSVGQHHHTPAAGSVDIDDMMERGKEEGKPDDDVAAVGTVPVGSRRIKGGEKADDDDGTSSWLPPTQKDFVQLDEDDEDVGNDPEEEEDGAVKMMQSYYSSWWMLHPPYPRHHDLWDDSYTFLGIPIDEEEPDNHHDDRRRGSSKVEKEEEDPDSSNDTTITKEKLGGGGGRTGRRSPVTVAAIFEEYGGRNVYNALMLKKRQEKYSHHSTHHQRTTRNEEKAAADDDDDAGEPSSSSRRNDALGDGADGVVGGVGGEKVASSSSSSSSVLFNGLTADTAWALIGGPIQMNAYWCPNQKKKGHHHHHHHRPQQTQSSSSSSPLLSVIDAVQALYVLYRADVASALVAGGTTTGRGIRYGKEEEAAHEHGDDHMRSTTTSHQTEAGEGVCLNYFDVSGCFPPNDTTRADNNSADNDHKPAAAAASGGGFFSSWSSFLLRGEEGTSTHSIIFGSGSDGVGADVRTHRTTAPPFIRYSQRLSHFIPFALAVLTTRLALFSTFHIYLACLIPGIIISSVMFYNLHRFRQQVHMSILSWLFREPPDTTMIASTIQISLSRCGFVVFRNMGLIFASTLLFLRPALKLLRYVFPSAFPAIFWDWSSTTLVEIVSFHLFASGGTAVNLIAALLDVEQDDAGDGLFNNGISVLGTLIDSAHKYMAKNVAVDLEVDRFFETGECPRDDLTFPLRLCVYFMIYTCMCILQASLLLLPAVLIVTAINSASSIGTSWWFSDPTFSTVHMGALFTVGEDSRNSIGDTVVALDYLQQQQKQATSIAAEGGEHSLPSSHPLHEHMQHHNPFQAKLSFLFIILGWAVTSFCKRLAVVLFRKVRKWQAKRRMMDDELRRRGEQGGEDHHHNRGWGMLFQFKGLARFAVLTMVRLLPLLWSLLKRSRHLVIIRKAIFFIPRRITTTHNSDHYHNNTNRRAYWITLFIVILWYATTSLLLPLFSTFTGSSSPPSPPPVIQQQKEPHQGEVVDGSSSSSSSEQSNLHDSIVNVFLGYAGDEMWGYRLLSVVVVYVLVRLCCEWFFISSETTRQGTREKEERAAAAAGSIINEESDDHRMKNGDDAAPGGEEGGKNNTALSTTPHPAVHDRIVTAALLHSSSVRPTGEQDETNAIFLVGEADGAAAAAGSDATQKLPPVEGVKEEEEVNSGSELRGGDNDMHRGREGEKETQGGGVFVKRLLRWAVDALQLLLRLLQYVGRQSVLVSTEILKRIDQRTVRVLLQQFEEDHLVDLVIFPSVPNLIDAKGIANNNER